MTLLISLFLFLTSLTARAQSLAELDRIVSEARDLKDFLSEKNETLRSRYLSALQAYYRDARLDDSVFLLMMDQLKALDKNIPGFGKRIWETTNLGEPFSISIESPTYGRKLNPVTWDAYLKKWNIENLVQSGAYYLIPDTELRERKLRTTAEDLERQISVHEQSLASLGLGRRQAAEKNTEFFRRLKSTPDFKSAAAYVLHRYVNSEQMRDRLQSGNADQILSFFRELDEAPGLLLRDKPADFPTAWLSLLKPQIPKLKDLLAMPKVFPQEHRTTREGKQVPVSKMGVVTYDFVPIPRRIHGIWKGIPLGECIGKECRRLATIAIEGSQLSMVETAGRPDGYIQMVPGQIRGKTYGSLDIGAPALSKRILPSPEAATGAATSLYEAWLEQIYPRLPRDWAGLVVGKDLAINNAQVIPTIHNSPSFYRSFGVGFGHEFLIQDPMSEKMGTLQDKHRGNFDYGNRMIVDATAAGNQEQGLTLLSPHPTDAPNRKSEGIQVNYQLNDLTTQEALARGLDAISLADFLNFSQASSPEEKRAQLGQLPFATLDRLRTELDLAILSPGEKSFLLSAIEGGKIQNGLNRLDVPPVMDRFALIAITANIYGIIAGAGYLALGRVFDDYLMEHPFVFASSFLGTISLGLPSAYYEAWSRARSDYPVARRQIEQTLRGALANKIPLSPSVIHSVLEVPPNRTCRDLAKNLRAILP